MHDNIEYVETVIVGGGQAGLIAGYELKRYGREFVILDAQPQVGDAWRNRWDSLRLFTPRRDCELPGLRFTAQRSLAPTKDEMADYLEAYAAHHDLPVRQRRPRDPADQVRRPVPDRHDDRRPHGNERHHRNRFVWQPEGAVLRR